MYWIERFCFKNIRRLFLLISWLWNFIMMFINFLSFFYVLFLFDGWVVFVVLWCLFVLYCYIWLFNLNKYWLSSFLSIFILIGLVMRLFILYLIYFWMFFVKVLVVICEVIWKKVSDNGVKILLRMIKYIYVRKVDKWI